MLPNKGSSDTKVAYGQASIVELRRARRDGALILYVLHHWLENATLGTRELVEQAQQLIPVPCGFSS